MLTFQRARSEKQRRIRRQAILDTAAAMLDDMPVSEVSLNELSRRVGLAKSNVLRYFESREAILLELLHRAAVRWMDVLAERLAAEIGPGGTAGERGDRLATVLAETLAEQRVLCDLFAAQAGVLEHNVSTEVTVHFKRAGADLLTGFSGLVRRHVPELGDHATKLCVQIAMLVGTVWTHSCQPENVRAAYEMDPSLAVLRTDFTTTLADLVATLISGTLARAR